MKKLRWIILLCVFLGGCHYPWYSVFKTTPETRQAEKIQVQDTKPTMIRKHKDRIIIRKVRPEAWYGQKRS